MGAAGRRDHSGRNHLQELDGGARSSYRAGDLTVRHTPPALIETVRIRNGAAPLWYLHLRRLAVSCKALGIPLPGELPPPEGGADRVYRLEVGMRGVQVSERLVGASAPARLLVSKVAHHSYPY